MGQKLHRGRRSVFKRRNPVLRILVSTLTTVAIVAIGFFGAKYLLENPISTDREPVSSAPVSTTNTTTTTQPTPETAVGLTDGIRAFYLPADKLTDNNQRTATLQAAKKAGFTGVVVDMKDADGNLYYRSNTDRAKLVNSYIPDALTAEQTRTVLTAIQEAGLRPIVRLFAFRDNAAARALADARIFPTGNSGWVWYDAKPANGGRAWLNPYADAAQLYLIDLARELKDLGAQGVLLDGVQFPHQVSGAAFGTSSNTSKSRNQILTAFVEQMGQMLGDTCPVILACTADSALGEKTQVYGGNPLTFGASAAAPILDTQGNVAEAIHQMTTRIKVIDKDRQPLLSPILQAENLTNEALKTLIKACADAGTDQYILYAPSGAYDFAGL